MEREARQEAEPLLVNDCPFCGKHDHVVWGEIFGRYYIACETCECRGRYAMNDIRKAVQYWNSGEFCWKGKFEETEKEKNNG